LRDNGFDPKRPTAWLTEGLLRYLPNDAQDRLFENIAELSAPGSRIALNIGMGTRTRTAAEREIRDKALAQAGIKMDIDGLWYSSEGRTDPRDWFTDHGWTVSQVDPIEVLTDRGREVPESVHEDLRRQILMTAVRP
jgi:methyltransferase (TIGR00027 family)